jgi:hypothetical protein
MPNRTTATDEILAYTLAIGELHEVSEAARLIAEQDPDLDPSTFVPEPGSKPPTAKVGPKSSRAALGDFRLRGLIETGLIVTYARPFTKGRGSGFPLPLSFVPVSKRDLHRRLKELRNKVYAHIDAVAPAEFGREGDWTVVEAGVEAETWKSPQLLNQDELRDLAELCDEVVARLRVARHAAQASGAPSQTGGRSRPPSPTRGRNLPNEAAPRATRTTEGRDSERNELPQLRSV